MLCQNLKASVKSLGSRVEAAVMVLASLQFFPGWIAGVGNRTQDKLAKLHPCITHGWRFFGSLLCFWRVFSPGSPVFPSSHHLKKPCLFLFELIINTALVLGKVTSTFESVKLAIYKANTNPAQC